MTTSIKLSELSAQHLGRTITISTEDGDVTGLLSGVRHEVRVNAYPTMLGRPASRSITRQATGVTLHGWEERRFWADIDATISDDTPPN